jgi:hypothetical protein
MLNTLGTVSSTIIIKEESYALTHSFSCATEIDKGVLVKLNTDGTVSPVAAVTDRPLGFVTNGNKNHNPTDKVTVLVPFSAICNCVASGAVAIGDELAGEAIATNGRQKWKKAVSNNIVSAVALEAAANNEEVLVGVLRTPYVKA